MPKHAFILAAAFAVTFATKSSADGLLYQLPPDGTWVKFDVDGNAEKPDGTKVTLTGELMIRFVGAPIVDGKPCRWIEIELHAKRNGEVFTDIDKLLIPQAQLAPGKDPLKGVLKIWHLHSQIASGPHEIKGTDEQVKSHLNNIRPFLHAPYKTPEKLERATVECKLGKVDCDGIKASEDFEHGGASYQVTYTVRLNKNAPTGVAAYKNVMKVQHDGKPVGTMTTEFTLIDFGDNAKSAIPDAE